VATWRGYFQAAVSRSIVTSTTERDYGWRLSGWDTVCGLAGR
jgi:hypothetical protein